ncbi:MAG: 50S ribosomal protein L10 [Nitrososphaerales archaeon]|jgi:large subunit ribosomal protein L10|nr:50S ribosomal protein L10 [Nitrososphaerales archaeon]|tara:strand:+ start:1817 stop:2683 length:867 start_codon:yes stop_codon:yes gene_type:complete
MRDPTGREYSTKKVETIRKINEYAEKKSVLALSKIRKVRARQMMTLRKQFRDEMNIVVAKNKISKMGLKNSKKNIDNFIEKITDQNAIIFTDMNPFKIQLVLEKNKVDLPARVGDIATDPVSLPSGNTSIPPGPVLSEFKELNVPTKIDAGSIFISKDTEVLKRGEVIKPKLASLLSRLGLKPIKAGLSLSAAYTDGVVFSAEDLKIDLEEYRNKIQKAHTTTLALSIEAAYLTKETIPMVLGKASLNAKTLALESAYTTEEMLPDILTSGQYKANSLLNLVKQKGYN